MVWEARKEGRCHFPTSLWVKKNIFRGNFRIGGLLGASVL